MNFLAMESADNLPGDIALGVAAAMARQYADDSRSFLIRLATILESSLPGEAEVQRAGLFGGDKRPIKRLEITLAEGTNAVRYAIDDPGRGPLAATRIQVVRGIALKTESIGISDWIAAVGDAVERRAQGSREVRNALHDILL